MSPAVAHKPAHGGYPGRVALSRYRHRGHRGAVKIHVHKTTYVDDLPPGAGAAAAALVERGRRMRA